MSSTKRWIVLTRPYCLEINEVGELFSVAVTVCKRWRRYQEAGNEALGVACNENKNESRDPTDTGSVGK